MESESDIIDTYFNKISFYNERPFLFKLFDYSIVNKFYVELFHKLKRIKERKDPRYDITSAENIVKSSGELYDIVKDIYKTIKNRDDIIEKIKDKEVDLIDLTDPKKKLVILDPSQLKSKASALKANPKFSSLFKTKSKEDIIKEKVHVQSDIFHPTQMKKKSVKSDEEQEKSLDKIIKNLTKIVGDKKSEADIMGIALSLYNDKTYKGKKLDLDDVKHLIKDKPSRGSKGPKEKLICKEGKLLNKFTEKCVDVNSATGIFMTSKNANIPEVTEADMKKYTTLKLSDLKKLCEKNAPGIGCSDMPTIKDVLKHVFNNINIHTNEPLCKEDKVWYATVNKCVEKKSKDTIERLHKEKIKEQRSLLKKEKEKKAEEEAKKPLSFKKKDLSPPISPSKLSKTKTSPSKSSKSSKTSKTRSKSPSTDSEEESGKSEDDDEDETYKRYKTVGDIIRKQIKENMKKKSPKTCDSDKVYNKFTDNCVKKDSASGIFVQSNYGNIDGVTKKDMDKFNEYTKKDLTDICNKYPHIGCNFNTKAELARHILDNIRLNKKELICDDGLVYYHDVQKCVKRRDSPSSVTSSKTTSSKTSSSKTSGVKRAFKSDYDNSDKYKPRPTSNRYGTVDEPEYSDKELYNRYANSLIKRAKEDEKVYMRSSSEAFVTLLDFMKTIHEIIIDQIITNTSKDKIKEATNNNEISSKIVDKNISKYFKESLFDDKRTYKMIKEQILDDASDKDVTNFLETFQRILYSMVFNYQLDKSKAFLNLLRKSYEPIKVVYKWKVKPKSSSKSDVESVITKKKTIEESVNDLIEKGIDNNLIGGKIKRKSAVKYLTKLIENMKTSFDAMIRRNDEELNDSNKFTLVNEYFDKNMDDKIDDIVDNLRECCLSELTSKNGKLWLIRYLPVALAEIY